MFVVITAIFAALLFAAADPGVAPASPSPAASSTPTPAPTGSKRTLRLAIPDGWVRTETGHYNEWRSPDGAGHFRVTALPASAQYRGPGAADAIKVQFQQIAGRFNPKATVTVNTVTVCNGTQPAYRVDDPLGLGSAGFMMIIPGSDSAGLINYEIMPGGKVDSGIMEAIDKICWP